jgi:DNA primase
VCNIGGDIFSFVMQREGVEFREALAMLAEEAGIALHASRTPAAAGSPSDKQTLFRALSWAQEQYHRCLLESDQAEPARAYLRQRHIDASSIARYQLGFAPAGWRWLADRATGTAMAPEVLRAVGLTRESPRSGHDYDYFRGRLMFPVHDGQGRVIAFGARVIPGVGEADDAKYINSPETRLFVKSEQLYGLDVAREAIRRLGYAVVMEGYTDVILARQHGLEPVAAVLGTALGAGHLRLLRRFADRVVLLLDGDAAGQKRTAEVLKLFIAAQMDVRIASLPDQLDPADFVHQRGAAALQAILDAAPDALQYKLQTQLRGVDVARDLHRANTVLEDILATIAQAPGTDLSSDDSLRMRENQVLAQLARTFMIEENELRGRLTALRHRRAPDRQAKVQAAEAPAPLHNWEMELFEILVCRPELVSLVLERIGPDDLYTEDGRQLLEFYRRLDHQGMETEFQRVLTEVESARLKSLLVEVDQRAHDKPAGDWDERLSDLFAAFQRRRQEATCRQWVSTLQRENLDDRQQLELLQSLIDQQRMRQGFAAPKDG